jgi:hypothetical protein
MSNKPYQVSIREMSKIKTVLLAVSALTAMPQSKEEERNQEMLEWIMKNIDRQKAEEFIQELEQISEEIKR